jgi:5'(3')-deoxyribonucleotidase
METIEDIALFDLDNTLCDYSNALKRDYELIRGPNDPAVSEFNDDSPEYVENRKRLITNQPGWWENLEIFQLGFDVLKIARELGFEIYILTKGPKRNQNAWAEKVRWAQKKVPDSKIILTEDKGLVYGKILVDDYPPYIQRWTQHRPRGLVIMPANSWNKDFSHPNTIRYDGTNIRLITEAMKATKIRNPNQHLVLPKNL